MFERFTDRARKVMALANQEAQRFNHEYVGTEHILLGLVREGSGVGAEVLKNLGVNLDQVQVEVMKLVRIGPDMVPMGKLPHTPRAKKIVEYAMEEAQELGHNYCGTEHLLLGLIREHLGVAAQVLLCLGLTLERVREEVVKLVNMTLDTNERVTEMPETSKTGNNLKRDSYLVLSKVDHEGETYLVVKQNDQVSLLTIPTVVLVDLTEKNSASDRILVITEVAGFRTPILRSAVVAE